ncbi:methyltransferase family protein [Chitinophaga skermanii]|uniref:Methyltransferase family protein n=1 Tax=Chitinophaga skermanii TaxID=331697 RepID=A0A327Q1X0_9BACT|nr:class I SAM-dependent methyltransferase [Chitinophaga skermanii]RAI98440.1 methyltransferase family protein [Chitinophaga skermanii]
MKQPNNGNFLDLNKQAWNDKVAVHFQSDFYNMPAFLAGQTSLQPIELALLGDVKGKKILHLQCHFGQDTLSLQRLGAQATGVDFSEKAIEKAREVNTQLGLNAQFICCDIYTLPAHLNEQFDIVFTSYGTIGWLPDLDKWAGVVQHFLKPGGQFVFAEFHPFIWTLDDTFEKIHYHYFNVEEIVENVSGTYTDRDAPLQAKTISWNHPLSEVLTALMQQGLQLTSFLEYDYSPYNCFPGMTEFAPHQFRFNSHGSKVPYVYALTAVK